MLFDPFDIGNTFLKLQHAWLAHPKDVIEAQQEYAMSMSMLNATAFMYMVGAYPTPCTKAVKADERFLDDGWMENPVNSMTMQNYLTGSRWFQRIVYDTPGVSKKERRSGAFWTRQWLNALAPSNFFATNPIAIRKAWESNGDSLRRGIENFLTDLTAQDIQTTPMSHFSIGKNLANTPGSVIFRNQLVEVIHYHPLRAKVRAIPIVMVPAWINKYYILDLNERMSMVRHLVNEGFDVYAVSWKNPDASMASLSYEAYVLDGVLAAINVARTVSYVPYVHAVGHCMGGTALATLMAWLNKKYRDPKQVPIAHWTLLSSLLDFARAGEIGALINEKSVTAIETIMQSQGYLDKHQITWAFRMLRPNSLIWHYVVHNYLYGEKPPPDSILYWNADGTRVPHALHSFCLRRLYLENKLAQKNHIAIDGYPIDLSLVSQPLYAVGAEEDHITPWRGTFDALRLISGPARYALPNAGHIHGIINPPHSASNRHYWVGDATGEIDGKAWRARQTKRPGTWWNDWTAWLHGKCGPLEPPPPIEYSPYRTLDNAPGTYVYER